MTWEYLDKPEFQIRYEMALLLTGSYRANVVDLNCGHNAPLMDLLYDDKFWAKSYYGNDILFKQPIEDSSFRKIVENVSDEKVNDRLKELDIHPIHELYFLGDGAGDYTKELDESSTAFASFVSIVRDHKPNKVVHESAIYLEEQHGILSHGYSFLLSRGYRRFNSVDLHIYPDIGFVSYRRFNYYRRTDV